MKRGILFCLGLGICLTACPGDENSRRKPKGGDGGRDIPPGFGLEPNEGGPGGEAPGTGGQGGTAVGGSGGTAGAGGEVLCPEGLEQCKDDCWTVYHGCVDYCEDNFDCDDAEACKQVCWDVKHDCKQHCYENCECADQCDE